MQPDKTNIEILFQNKIKRTFSTKKTKEDISYKLERE